MQWSCPHCGTQLALSDDKLGTGWSFSRCYKCGGFALIRRAELSIIKVDKAPTGERVLLPEASDATGTRTPMLSMAAAQNYARYLGDRPVAPSRAPTVRPAVLRSHSGGATPPRALRSGVSEVPIQTSMHPSQAQSPVQPQVQTQLPAAAAAPVLPEPLPEISTRAAVSPRLISHLSSSSHALYGAIGVTTLMALGSGLYLYSEGKALWRKARSSLTSANHRTHSAVTPAAHHQIPAGSENEVIQPPATQPAFSAGAPLQVERPAVMTDQLPNQAMAPARISESQEKAPLQAPPSKMTVSLRKRGAHLYTGPGVHFPVVGLADPDLNYVVTDWTNEWFKVELDSESRRAISEYNKKSAQGRRRELLVGTTAWIRNDKVRITVDEPFSN